MRTVILSELQMYMNVWTVTSKVTNILVILTLHLFRQIPVRLNSYIHWVTHPVRICVTQCLKYLYRHNMVGCLCCGSEVYGSVLVFSILRRG